ncbi:MAG: lysylphosphatidylglycerol synthase transmembrane domain-containing protein [bacterium]
MKKFILVLLSLIAGVALFVFVLQKFGWQEIIKAVLVLPWWQFFTIPLLILSGFLIAVVRWRVVLQSQTKERITFLTTLRARTVGFAISYLTPSAYFGGEALRAVILNEDSNVNLSTNIFSIIVDKAIDMTIGAFLMLIGLIYILIHFRLPAWITYLILLVVIFWIGMGYFFYSRTLKKKGFFTSLINFFWLNRVKSVNKLTSNIQDVETTISDFFLHKPKYLISTILLGFTSRCFQFGAAWLIIYSLQVRVSIFQLLGFMALFSVMLFVPVPGAFGLHEASQALFFGLFGLGGYNGIAFSLILRAYHLVGVVIGLLILLIFQIGIWKNKALKKLDRFGRKIGGVD